MSMMGELRFFLGFEIKQLREGTFIFQAKYIQDMLKRFNMKDLNGAKTPMATNCHLALDPGGASGLGSTRPRKRRGVPSVEDEIVEHDEVLPRANTTRGAYLANKKKGKKAIVSYGNIPLHEYMALRCTNPYEGPRASRVRNRHFYTEVQERIFNEVYPPKKNCEDDRSIGWRFHQDSNARTKEVIEPLYMPGRCKLGFTSGLQPVYDIMLHIYRETVGVKVGNVDEIHSFVIDLMLETHLRRGKGVQMDVMDCLWNQIYLRMVEKRSPSFAPFIMKLISEVWRQKFDGAILEPISPLTEHPRKNLLIKDHGLPASATTAPPTGPSVLPLAILMDLLLIWDLGKIPTPYMTFCSSHLGTPSSRSR
ncbi:hypothetical protein QYE76_003505 [Lolium multiflorum]|uniref:Reverse transcriptase Ty1/copia-type domain-containing protein n=1 Tax=Lolium multiflorum TaxID=4521 RepID=A0AAD8VYW4_LOLMU|nr:hypothetical protein QYE76_003505 [Lolium multiflorum]